MVMRAALFAAATVLTCSCSKKDKAANEQTAAVDRYANVDMQHNFAVLWTGVRPFKTLKDDVIDAGLEGWLDGAMGEIVMPRMTEFLAGADKVSVPVPMTAAHAMLLDIARTYRDVAKDMLDAGHAKDAAKFKAAHARMLETRERYTRWQTAFDAVLKHNGGVVFREVPALDEPLKPVKKVTYCGDVACPCEGGGSGVVHDDKLTSCKLTTAIEIQGASCAPGLVRFRDDGSLLACMFAGDDYYLAGEATFHSNGNVANATSNLMASPYAGLVCGAGPARWFADGKYEACTLRGDAEIAGLPIPKGATAFVVFYPGGKIRYVKYGKDERCLDLAAAPVTPCAAPTW